MRFYHSGYNKIKETQVYFQEGPSYNFHFERKNERGKVENKNTQPSLKVN